MRATHAACSIVDDRGWIRYRIRRERTSREELLACEISPDSVRDGDPFVGSMEIEIIRDCVSRETLGALE